jgi:hypothetical protein
MRGRSCILMLTCWWGGCWQRLAPMLAGLLLPSEPMPRVDCAPRARRGSQPFCSVIFHLKPREMSFQPSSES